MLRGRGSELNVNGKLRGRGFRMSRLKRRRILRVQSERGRQSGKG